MLYLQASSPLPPALPTITTSLIIIVCLPLHGSTTISVIEDVQLLIWIKITQETKTCFSILVNIQVKGLSHLVLIHIYDLQEVYQIIYSHLIKHLPEFNYCLPTFSNVSYMYIFFYFCSISKISILLFNFVLQCSMLSHIFLIVKSLEQSIELT